MSNSCSSFIRLAVVSIIALIILPACNKEPSGGTEAIAIEPAAEAEIAPAQEPREEQASLVLRGGKVISVDPELGDAEAIAVNDHVIAALGSDEEIAAYIGPETRVIEAPRRRAHPVRETDSRWHVARPEQ